MEQQHTGCRIGVTIPDCLSAWGHCAHLMPSTGDEGCRDTAVLTGRDLQLLLEEPLPLEWISVIWKVELGAEPRQRILTVWKDKVEPANSSLSRRAIFHREPFSLQISAVTQADNRSYFAEIEKSDGSVSTKCFHVSVWGECLDLLPSSLPIPSNLSVPAEPVGSPHLETRVLQQEQGRCSFQLSCTVPEATAVSYSWSRDWEPLGNQSVLEVPKDVQPGLYVCNVSNPVSWSMVSIDTATACSQTGDLSSAPLKPGLGLHRCKFRAFIFPPTPSLLPPLPSCFAATREKMCPSTEKGNITAGNCMQMDVVVSLGKSLPHAPAMMGAVLWKS